MQNPLNNGSISWNNWSYLQHEKAFEAFKNINVSSMRFIPVSHNTLMGIIRRQKAKVIIN